ncbi:MAG: hypothetical protein U0414_07120 [Polyangiaceae bacterium]
MLKKGKEQYQQGLITQACETLQKAEGAEPNVESIGLVAACHEKQNKTASAYKEYLVTAERAAKAADEREKFARDQAARLEPLVPRLTISLPADEHPKVTVNGEELDANMLAASRMYDPGSYTIVAKDASGKSWSKEVTLSPSDKFTLAIPASATWAGGEPPGPAPPAGEKRYAPGPPAPAIIAGVIGFVGLGVMGGGGIAAIVLNGDSKDIEDACRSNPSGCDEQKGRDERDSATAAANAANVGLGVGIAGLVTAGFLWGFHVGAKEIDAKDAEPKKADALSIQRFDLVPVFGPERRVEGGAISISGSF